MSEPQETGKERSRECVDCGASMDQPYRGLGLQLCKRCYRDEVKP